MGIRVYQVQCICEGCDMPVMVSDKLFDEQGMKEARLKYVINALLFQCSHCGKYGVPVVSKINEDYKWEEVKELNDGFR